MTLRKQLIISLVLISISAIILNSIFLIIRINKNFLSYMTASYNENISQIQETVKKSMIERNMNENQLAVALEGYLDDPIIGVKLFNNNGNEILSIKNTSSTHHMMMNMRDNETHSMMENPRENVSSYNITYNKKNLGTLHIVTYSTIQASYQSKLFKDTLIQNSIVIGGAVIVVVIILSIYLSKKLEKDLKTTEALASNIDLGIDENIKNSNIKEIAFIQGTLMSLRDKLKIKQTVRKQLLDQLVHQTRTPLTILKTHLEGFEDGMIEMDDKEINVLEEQINQIELIISNMSEMIENEKEEEKSTLEEISLRKMLLQISNGLKMQFKKKNVELKFIDEGDIKIITDKYKLSQSIYNILTNAYKFTEAGGVVEVKLTRKEKVQIAIKDTGIGIKSGDLDNIFNPYYRGNNTTGINGEGIGLYIAKQNIESLDGEIKVTSTIKKGTEFKIIL